MTNDSATGCAGRLPAEWERQSAVLLSWPHKDTDWAYMLDQVTACFIEIAENIARYAGLVIVTPDKNITLKALAGKVPDERLRVYEIPTNDTWARDFGYISLVNAEGRVTALDFKFNGWGLKFAADKDNLINSLLRHAGALSPEAAYLNRLNFVLEGGSIESDGKGTILTTSQCLLSPNRNGQWSRAQIQSELADSLGCNRVLWLEHGALEGDDTDSHIDTLARFIPAAEGAAIAYTSCDRPDDSHYSDLLEMRSELAALRDCQGRPYRTFPLPIPTPIYDEDGQRLPATYANFLIINGAVLVPIYNDPKYDAIALDNIRRAMPGYEVVGIDCRALIQQHGSLHCVTMQLPVGLLK